MTQRKPWELWEKTNEAWKVNEQWKQWSTETEEVVSKTKTIINLLTEPIKNLKTKIRSELEDLKANKEKIDEAIDNAIQMIIDTPSIDISIWLNIFSWLVSTYSIPWNKSHSEKIKNSKKMLEDFLKVLKAQLNS